MLHFFVWPKWLFSAVSKLFVAAVMFLIFPNTNNSTNSKMQKADDSSSNDGGDFIFGGKQGLVLSLSLFSFFLFGGILKALMKSSRRLRVLNWACRWINLLEIPIVVFILLSSIWISPESFLPSVFVKYVLILYKCILYLLGPLLIILDSVCVIILIDISGKFLATLLHSRETRIGRIVFGILLIALSLTIVLISALIIINIFYDSSLILNIVSGFPSVKFSMLLSSVLTLVFVALLLTFYVDKGVITDVALLFLYTSFILWQIAELEKSELRSLHSKASFIDSGSFSTNFSMEMFFSWISHIPFGLQQKFYNAILGGDILAGLLLRLTLFIVTAQCLCLSNEEEDEDSIYSESTSLIMKERNLILSSKERFYYSEFLQLFGKAFFVLIYSVSWISANNLDNYEIPSFIISLTGNYHWKWISLYLAIAFYTLNLTEASPTSLLSITSDTTYDGHDNNDLREFMQEESSNSSRILYPFIMHRNKQD